MAKYLFGCLCAFTMAITFATSSFASDADDTTRMAIAAITAQAERFSQAYIDGDIETLVSIYAEDGIAAPGGRDFIIGHDALRQFWQIRDGIDVTHHQSRSQEIIIEGRYAYDWGYYQGAIGKTGDPKPFRGKYVIFWRHDDDGVWRMVQDMWNRLPENTDAK